MSLEKGKDGTRLSVSHLSEQLDQMLSHRLNSRPAVKFERFSTEE